MVEHFCVKFGDPSCSVVRINRETDRQTDKRQLKHTPTSTWVKIPDNTIGAELTISIDNLCRRKLVGCSCWRWRCHSYVERRPGCRRRSHQAQRRRRPPNAKVRTWTRSWRTTARTAAGPAASALAPPSLLTTANRGTATTQGVRGRRMSNSSRCRTWRASSTGAQFQRGHGAASETELN